MPAGGFNIDPCIVMPSALVSRGVILVMVTGPTTHQSPLTNCPVGRSALKVHVIPDRLTDVAAKAGVPRAHKRAAATTYVLNVFALIIISCQPLWTDTASGKCPHTTLVAHESKPLKHSNRKSDGFL